MSNLCRIHLTYKGGYISKEVTQVSSQGSLDEITVGAFKINAGLPNAFSRCFIEVALLPLDLCPSFGAFFIRLNSRECCFKIFFYCRRWLSLLVSDIYSVFHIDFTNRLKMVSKATAFP